VTGAPEQARTHLTVGVSENGISDADKNGVRTAQIDLWIQSELADTHLNGSATAKDTDANLYLSAIENALQQFSAGLYATEVSDTFIVREGEGLTEANNKLLDGDFPGAVAAYNERLAQVANDVKALCNLSAALTAMGDLQGALDVATRAIEADVPSYRYNRKADAQAAADRIARTTKMLGNTTYGAPKK
jgi:tetratricopeptide (TPR) repeat protein